MARGREGIAKRAREKARIQRQEAKRIRRQALLEESTQPDPDDEARLMEEFRLLSERRAASKVSESTYEAERQRIFAELGIEPG
jgi:hypothetical protein